MVLNILIIHILNRIQILPKMKIRFFTWNFKWAAINKELNIFPHIRNIFLSYWSFLITFKESKVLKLDLFSKYLSFFRILKFDYLTHSFWPISYKSSVKTIFPQKLFFSPKIRKKTHASMKNLWNKTISTNLNDFYTSKWQKNRFFAIFVASKFFLIRN